MLIMDSHVVQNLNYMDHVFNPNSKIKLLYPDLQDQY